MRPIALDKIASVTLRCRLSREVKVGDEYPCREGDVVAVRILSSKTTYDQLELVTGRMCQLRPGDVLAGALGHRRALRGYAGHLPTELATGARIHLLNLGGVLGVCDSINPDLGAPFECEVLGQVLAFPYVGERISVPANISQGLPAMAETLDLRGVPLVAIAGTCMSAGKTQACSGLIQELTRRRLRVHACKATGVSLRRDILAMEDAGAVRTTLFTDLGIVTTSRATAAGVARTMLATLVTDNPDVIVCELGDGLMGEYGVDEILSDPVFQGQLSALVLAANDPVGAWGAHRRLAELYGLEIAVVTGPATDNIAGTELIQRELGVPALNARTHPAELAQVVLERIGGPLKSRAEGR